MIRSFQHKGLELFYRTGKRSGINSHHGDKLRIQLTALEAAESVEDLRAPLSWRLHALTGKLEGFYSLTVNANWRIIFRFNGVDVELVDYLDYH